MMLDAAFEGVDVGELMTPAGDLATVEADLPLDDLLDLMLEERHTGYPVLDGGEFVGIVTLEDVQSTDRIDGVVSDAMTAADSVRTVSPSSEVMDAFRALGRTDVGRLPVVEDGELRGILTRTDLMRAFKIVVEQQRFEAEHSRAALGSEPQ
jgi:CBS domain-containing protein